ncbi:tyrosine protein phosphatase [Agarivorans sp. Toyoura001]|uniref:tyrosine-protein phosphatase n=1 Tax=Agarivorans sp. Toyoura001 TaxID=2283141 RepID=UPI0010D36269|nr:CpsB/CapC family capsule biosynthesis tyrosine phosphatase [Agarivorans sp. Toyoura001]GDY24302.1 tyrosine protein phosphatase [Agarivorans sp. Toyoura001]
MFIDLHSHILPGIDDGAQNLQQAIEMVSMAQANGTKVMVATPHMHPGTYNNTPATIEAAFNTLQIALSQRDIDVELRSAAEVHLCPEVMQWAMQEKLPFIGEYQQKPLLLLELPHGSVPQGTSTLIRWLQKNSIQVMIAHPERNHGIWKNPYQLSQLIKLGCLFQVTADSFLGKFRQQAQSIAESLLKAGSIHILASDAHDIEKRTTNLNPAFERIKHLSNEEHAKRLLWDNPAQILGIS